MRRCNLVAIACALCGLLVAAAPSDEPVGTWKVQILSRDRSGGRVSILRLRMDGSSLSGAIIDQQGPSSPIENASYVEGRVSFDVTRVLNGQKFTTQYSGTLAGDTIQGTMQSERRGGPQRWVATRTTPEEVAREVGTPPVAADIDLRDENYTIWRDHILPDPGELAWEQIPWLATFKDGILAAQAVKKPLLLWTMNGHPLGCT